MNLSVLRSGVQVASVPLDDKTTLTHKLMGEHRIAVESVVPAPLAIEIGDYIEHGAERYYMNSKPTVEKVNNFTYRYTMDFEGEVYYLYNKLFMDEGQADFSYHGAPGDFLQLLLDNINSIQTGWTIGGVDAATEQTLSFTDDTCRSALTKVAEAFGMEYRLSGKAIFLQKSVGVATAHSFEYGRGKGLYSITRETVNEKGLVTRLFGFGARKNLAPDYRAGATRLVFNERYLENNLGLFGVREGAVTFDDIYPQRTGAATAVNGADIFQITDSTLNFDINAQLIEGTVAKIVFKTGALAGYEFEIRRYNHTTKTIEFLPFQEDNGYELPNVLNYPEVGDQYTLVDITMPQTYIDEAELLLKTRTQEYLDENSVPRATYAIELDEKYVKAQGVALRPGDLVQVIDAQLGINSTIRVAEVSYPLVNTNQITALFSDTIPYTIEERLLAETIDNRTLTRSVDRRRAELARRSVSRLRQLQDLVFDPDGYFDPGNIKPTSIETLMLSVGAKSQNFGLIGVTIQPNSGGNANALNISGGQLVHYEIEIDGLGYVWAMDPRSFSGLDPLKHYYLAAKCSKSALTGIWELSEVPREVEAEAGQYIFNLGILYAVADGRRDFDFTNGMTFISGDTITTGTIRSLDGLAEFNLSQGTFKIGDSNYSLDWNITNPGRLTIKGGLLQTSEGSPIVVPNWRGAYNPATSYFKGDVVSYNGNSYTNKTDTATVGVVPTNVAEWDPFVPGGAAGIDGQDGNDAFGYIPDVGDAMVGGQGDFIFTLDSQLGGGVNLGGVRVQWTRFTKPDGTQLTATAEDNTVITTFGEGTAGRFMLLWSNTLMHTRFPSHADSNLINNNFMPLYWNGTEYRLVKNNGISTQVVAPTSTDVFLCVIEAKTTTSGLTGIEIFVAGAAGLDGAPGADGADGADGAPGADGPGLVFRGVFATGNIYYNNALRRDVVKYAVDGLYYIYNGTNGATVGSWVPANWQSFGAQFESVATNLLLAESANIADFVIANGRITAQDSSMTMYGPQGAIIWNTIAVNGTAPNSRIAKSGLFISATGVDAEQPPTVYDANGNPVTTASTGPKAGIVGKCSASGTLLRPSVGVYGETENQGTYDFGGYFIRALIDQYLNVNGPMDLLGSLRGAASAGFGVVRTSSSLTLTAAHCFVICTSSGATTITLPSSVNRYNGMMIVVKRAGSGAPTIGGNGANLWHNADEGASMTINTVGHAYICVWDGSYWQVMITTA